METLTYGFEVEARSGDIPVDYNQASLRGEVLFKDIDLTGVGCRRNYRDVRISAVDMFVIQRCVTDRG